LPHGAHGRRIDFCIPYLLRLLYSRFAWHEEDRVVFAARKAVLFDRMTCLECRTPGEISHTHVVFIKFSATQMHNV
jgi:hypothetical protein